MENPHNAVVHRGIPDAQYRSIKALSKSSLTSFLKSPAHYLASTETPKETTDAMMFGTAYHTYILTPDRFDDHVCIKPKWDARTKEGKQAKADFEAALNGRVCISEDEMADIIAMSKALLSHPIAAEILAQKRENEMAIEADHPIGKGKTLRIKGLLDGWIEETKTIFDLKTCKDASPAGFKKAVRDFRYDMQEAQYKHLIAYAGLGRDEVTFKWIAQEKEAPFAVAVYVLSARTVGNAIDEWRLSLENFHECQTKGIWPGYADTKIIELEVVL